MQTFQISKFIVFKNKFNNQTYHVYMSYKAANFFLCYIYTNIYTEISKQQLKRKYKAL